MGFNSGFKGLIIPALSGEPSLLRAHREVLSPFKIVLCMYQ